MRLARTVGKQRVTVGDRNGLTARKGVATGMLKVRGLQSFLNTFGDIEVQYWQSLCACTGIEPRVMLTTVTPPETFTMP